MKNTLSVFKNQFNAFRPDKFQLLFYLVWAIVTILWPLISGLGFGEAEYWDYPRQIAPALGLIVAGGLTIWIFASTVTKHAENGDLFRVKLSAYLLGVGGFYLVLNVMMAIFIALVGTLAGFALVNYVLILALTTICTMFIGAIIGILSHNSKMALQISYPIGLVFVMLFKFRNGIPAFQMINPIRSYINWFYMERVNHMLVDVYTGLMISDVMVLLGNIIVLGLIFVVLFKFKVKSD